MAPVTRHFVKTAAGRLVHYRRAGSGPPLILLHASPCSSKVQLPLLRAWSDDFTAIALDTPGFGQSEALASTEPEISDLADALVETLDALAVQRALLYGRHTGGSIAVEFARRYPDRAAFVLTDGYTIVPKTPTDAYLDAYLPPIEPRWDGGHLLWLWHRYREQHIFWPWNQPDRGVRADADVPDLADLQRGVVELLESGNNYIGVYKAALRYRWDAPLPHLQVPVCFGVRPGDSQFRHADYLRLAGMWVETMPRAADAAARRELDILRAHAEALPTPGLPAVSLQSELGYVTVADKQLLVRQCGNGSGLPLLMLPAAPNSSAIQVAQIRELAARRRVIAIDIPGSGGSDGLDGPVSVAAWTQTIVAALDRLGVGEFVVHGHNGGAAVASELAINWPERVKRVILDGPVCLAEPERSKMAACYAPDFRPRWDGAHLVELWHMLRDQQLWWPWYDKTLAAIRPEKTAIDTDTLHRRAADLVARMDWIKRCWQAVFDYALAERIGAISQPMMIGAALGDVFLPCLGEARRMRPEAVRGDFRRGKVRASIDAFLRGL